MVRLSGVLFGVALLCAITLALINRQTAPVIAAQQEKQLQESLRAVLAADSYQRCSDAGDYFEARDAQGNLRGWCLECGSKGYGGLIRVLVGVDADGRITGLNVLEHQETPGLGSKISESTHPGQPSDFLRQFTGKSVEDLVLVKSATTQNIQAITGATISSQAVVKAVRERLESFLAAKAAQ